MSMCQPELELTAEAINSRLTRVENQLRTGSITVKSVPVPEPQQPEDEELPPVPDDSDAPPVYGQEMPEEAPVGFWTDIAAEVRSELKPPLMGFFATTPNAPVKGILQGDKLVLVCSAPFIKDMINKPEVLDLIGSKATAKLGRKIVAVAKDQSEQATKSAQLEQLLQFGRDHSDIINIK